MKREDIRTGQRVQRDGKQYTVQADDAPVIIVGDDGERVAFAEDLEPVVESLPSDRGLLPNEAAFSDEVTDVGEVAWPPLTDQELEVAISLSRSDSVMHRIATELKEKRAAWTRLEEWAEQLDIHNHPVRSTRDVAAELRNRMRGSK